MTTNTLNTQGQYLMPVLFAAIALAIGAGVFVTVDPSALASAASTKHTEAPQRVEVMSHTVAACKNSKKMPSISNLRCSKGNQLRRRGSMVFLAPPG